MTSFGVNQLTDHSGENIPRSNGDQEASLPGAKEERFLKHSEQRVNAVLDKIRQVVQLTNRNSYEWNEVQVEQMFKAIEKELREARSKFKEAARPSQIFTWHK